jgi:FkbM family methyltransferase
VGWKRRGADLLERVLGARIVPPGSLPVLYEQEFLTRFLREFAVDCVFDVGANVGQYGQMLRTRAGYTGHIVSFEPIPEVADELRRAAREDPHWHVEEVALSNEPGAATFNVMEHSEFSSLLRPSQQQGAVVADLNTIVRQVPVRLDTVAAMHEKYERLLGFRRPFLKMDTQGNDLAVVNGAGDRLTRFVGLQSELAVQVLYEGGTRFTEAIATYEGLGFRLSAMFPNNTGHFPDVLEFDCVMYRRGADAAIRG